MTDWNPFKEGDGRSKKPGVQRMVSLLVGSLKKKPSRPTKWKDQNKIRFKGVLNDDIRVTAPY